MQKQQSQPTATPPKTEGKAAAQPTCTRLPTGTGHGKTRLKAEREREAGNPPLGLVTSYGLTLRERIGPSVGHAQPQTSAR